MNKSKQNQGIVLGWSIAGFAIGFTSGYLLLDGVASGVILGIALGLAMGLGGKEFSSRRKK